MSRSLHAVNKPQQGDDMARPGLVDRRLEPRE
jgi:hypothetical protein